MVIKLRQNRQSLKIIFNEFVSASKCKKKSHPNEPQLDPAFTSAESTMKK